MTEKENKELEEHKKLLFLSDTERLMILVEECIRLEFPDIENLEVAENSVTFTSGATAEKMTEFLTELGVSIFNGEI